jgi:hypothetical protein
MKLFIQIREGQPYEHPVMEANMKQLFPAHDLETAPDGFAKFTRVAQPIIGAYEKFDDSLGQDGCTYDSDDEGFKDVWHIVPLSETEKAEKIATTKQESPYPSWIFHEPDCTMRAPVEYPSDDKIYRWDEEIINWVFVN